MSTVARDIGHACLVRALATPAARTATLTGTGVDCLTGDGIINAVQSVGVVSGTNPTWDGVIQESADNSTGWTTIGTFTQVTASTNLQTIQCQRTKRYIRYVGTIGGTSTPTFNGACLLVEDKKQF